LQRVPVLIQRVLGLLSATLALFSLDSVRYLFLNFSKILRSVFIADPMNHSFKSIYKQRNFLLLEKVAICREGLLMKPSMILEMKNPNSCFFLPIRNLLLHLSALHISAIF
jgi:hypothetical protein